MHGEGEPAELLVGEPLDLVVDPLHALVGHHLALRLEHRRLDGEVDHAVGLQLDHHLEVAGRHRVPVVGPVDPGAGVAVAAGGLDQAIELAGRARAGLAEHEVLEQVGHPGLARQLVARADRLPGLIRQDGRRPVGHDDEAQAVVQAVAPDLESGERVCDLGCPGHGTSVLGQREPAFADQCGEAALR